MLLLLRLGLPLSEQSLSQKRRHSLLPTHVPHWSPRPTPHPGGSGPYRGTAPHQCRRLTRAQASARSWAEWRLPRIEAESLRLRSRAAGPATAPQAPSWRVRGSWESGGSREGPSARGAAGALRQIETPCMPAGWVASDVWLCVTAWTAARQGRLSTGFSREGTGAGCCALLQGRSSTQGLNPPLSRLLRRQAALDH